MLLAEAYWLYKKMCNGCGISFLISQPRLLLSLLISSLHIMEIGCYRFGLCICLRRYTHLLVKKITQTFRPNVQLLGLMIKDSGSHYGPIPLLKLFLGSGALQSWVINLTSNMPGFRQNHKDGPNIFSSPSCLAFLLVWVVLLVMNFCIRKKLSIR